MSTTQINPFTQKKITVGGKTHQLVMKIQSGPGSFEEKRQAYLKATHATKKLKYKDVPDKYFCGESGGYPAGTHAFPVDSEKRCRAALSYAHNAPNPQGIRDCALKIAAENGWNCGKYSKAGKKKTTGKKKITGYQLFVKELIPKMKNQGLTGKQAFSAAAKAWKSLDKAIQTHYNQEAKKLNPPNF